MDGIGGWQKKWAGGIPDLLLCRLIINLLRWQRDLRGAARNLQSAVGSNFSTGVIAVKDIAYYFSSPRSPVIFFLSWESSI